MKSSCKKCKSTVSGTFSSGSYHFNHCGQHWAKSAKDRGEKVTSTHGTRFGAALGAVFGLGSGDISGGAAGAAIGAAIGSAFDTDNGFTCPKCRTNKAYPTGHSKYGKNQYQCKSGGCKAYTYR